MPIVKEPVVYCFGILSNIEHEKLQWKLWKKYLSDSAEKTKPKKVQKNPFQLTEEFIEDFNDSLKTDDKEDFIELARKMLARCKRRSGLCALGCGKHVDLPVAWTETVMLSQCKGEIQEEALDILLISLDHAPVSPDHIPALFFVAESILYRICYDAVQKPYLFSCEIKLSKVGFLVFLRLLILHLSGYLEFCGEQKSRLNMSLKALAACEIAYQLYPNISFTVNFMLKAGETICESAILSDSALASDANLEEVQKETFQDTSLTSTGTLFVLNSGSKQSQIKPFLWHSLLVWVCVHNSCSEIDEVLKHVLFYKEQLHQKDWLESLLALMVLGEAAKLNMSCLKVLMDLVRDFISGSMPLQKQPKSNIIKLSCWKWQVGYLYTNILREICLRGISADLQKTAFLGFCDCAEQFKNGKELRGASFLDLLHYYPSADDSHDPFWVIRYGVVYNLVILHSELSGDAIREGLRNAVWKSLQKQKVIEKEGQVLDALKVAEVETKGVTNPFLEGRGKVPAAPRERPSSQYIGWRITTALSHHFLPPIGPDIPLPHQPVWKPQLVLYQEPKISVKQKKYARQSIRENFLQPKVPKHPDFFTRTDKQLKKIIDDQWEKELRMRLELEEQLQQLELKEIQKLEEERFRRITKWRWAKLHKTTKPYELSLQCEEEEKDLTEESGSTELTNVLEASHIWEPGL
ncbi:transmembrane protein 232 [Eublepharis macularius]|uniref:Transmembrane protein 232 n=1 Tax=Eublepharis macularius TaxID=481883 RepID=A0AA97L7X2_EUBMA|nr:transmembrane protein 232 [Eublepharis macularius]